MKGLAHIGEIVKVRPIEGADRIEQATVDCGSAGRWSGVVKKGDFSDGDLAEVYLQDALLPETERFAFLEKRHYRITMARLRGAPSECLIMPLTVGGIVGDDIADMIGVTKYEKQIPVNMGGQIKGAFPSFIPKTDEVRFQIGWNLVEALNWNPWVATEKADGTSATVYIRDGEFGSCSRNWEMQDDSNNVYWEMVRKYKLRELLEWQSENLALQFEIVGRIQKNPMGLANTEIRLFDIYDIDAHTYLDRKEMTDIAEAAGVPVAPVVEEGEVFLCLGGDKELLYAIADGNYPNGNPREGVVIRPRREMRVDGERLSFKVINLNYKD